MKRNLLVLLVLFIGVGCALSAPALAGGKGKVLHAFHGGSDGSEPYGALISDSSRNFYGTTKLGGGTGCSGGAGCGTVFELAPHGTEKVLYAFKGGSDGANPMAALLSDNMGNLYGTTQAGGASDEGTVFVISPDGIETQIYAFKGGSDGAAPSGSLIMASGGDRYGTTENGGSGTCGTTGCGTVFEITAAGAEKVIYSFQGGSDGAGPAAGLIADSEGNMYGTTFYGGGNQNCSGFGCGTVFIVTPDGTESVLYSFQGNYDGAGPTCNLIFDDLGNLYGTTRGGGPPGHGTVFELSPDGTETVLYSFQAGLDGNIPVAGVIMDTSGNLYGATYSGGSTKCHGFGCGTVFKVAPNGREKVLYAFGQDRYPEAALLAGPHGLLYGTTTVGGAHKDGAVFSVKK